jgi:peptidoglycan/LPS O-acetylase OafA/YrhL
MLNLRWIVFLGGLSYSLYLWQQVFLDPHSAAMFTSFPMNIGAALVVAAASFYFVERPALRLKTALVTRSVGVSSKLRPGDAGSVASLGASVSANVKEKRPAASVAESKPG